jgi:hypothetical protein
MIVFGVTFTIGIIFGMIVWNKYGRNIKELLLGILYKTILKRTCESCEYLGHSLVVSEGKEYPICNKENMTEHLEDENGHCDNWEQYTGNY